MPRYGFFIGADFNSEGFTSRTRSLLQVGGPLPGFKLTLDDAEQPQQEDVYYDFFSSVRNESLGWRGGGKPRRLGRSRKSQLSC